MYRAHLDRLVRTRLEESLLDEGVLPRERIESAQLEQDQSGKLLSDVLVDADLMDEWDLAKLICGRFGLPFVDVKGYTRRREVVELLPREWCLRNGIIPLDQFGQTLMIACQEIPSAEAVREITMTTGCFPFVYVGLRRAIREVLDEQIKKPPPAPKAKAPAKPGPGSKAPAPAEAAPIPVVEPEPPPKTEDLPPLDLPAISMKLDASATAVGASNPKKPAIQRFNRPAAPGAPGGKAAPEKAPVPSAAAEKPLADSPITAPIGPAAGPRLAARAAPVVPTPASKTPAGPHSSTWQSIFDVGEDNVRRNRGTSKTGEPPPKKK